MEPNHGQDARARSGSLHWRPHHSWYCHRGGTGTRSASASTWPPPGLHPPDFSNWNLPFPEAPPTRGLSTPSGGLPGIGRQTAGPRALGQKAFALPMQASSAPQGMLPVHQPRPHQPATPYQQAAQPQNQPATPYQQAAQLQSQPTTPYGQVVQPSSQPATPYQQAVQPPRRSTRRDCWPDLPQTEPLLHLTKPSLTVEGNRPGDRASEADQPVTLEEAEG